MKESFFEPPGIHQRAERSINELLEELKALHAQNERQGREFVTGRHKEGDLLARLKIRIGHKNWGKWCEEHLPYDIRTAQRRIRAAERYRQRKCDNGVSHLDDDLKAQVQDEEEVTETESSNATISSPTAAWPENNRCRDCRVQGLNDPNCKACRERNKPPAPPSRPNNRSAPDPTFAENLEARAEHGPGADDGDLDEAAAALAAMLAKKVRHKVEAAALRLCKVVAESLGLEVVLQGVGADPKFSHPLIQQAYKKMMQAKWDLSHALVPPSEKTK